MPTKERPEYPCRAPELQASLNHIAFLIGGLRETLKHSSGALEHGMPIQGSPISSKAARRTGTGMRRLIRWLPMLDFLVSVLRIIGPWASLAIAWIVAALVSWWKGVIHGFGSWLP
jgi:hypothetical protein